MEQLGSYVPTGVMSLQDTTEEESHFTKIHAIHLINQEYSKHRDIGSCH